MDDTWVQRLEHAVLLAAFALAVLAAVGMLEATTVSSLDLGRLPRWAVLAGAALVVGALALPAAIFFGWQSAESEREEATGRRRS